MTFSLVSYDHGGGGYNKFIESRFPGCHHSATLGEGVTNADNAEKGGRLMQKVLP